MTLFHGRHCLLLSTMLLSSLLGSSIAFAQSEPPTAAPQLPLNEVRMFTEALDRIRMSYVEEIDDVTL